MPAIEFITIKFKLYLDIFIKLIKKMEETIYEFLENALLSGFIDDYEITKI